MKGARKKGKRTSSSCVTSVLLLLCASLVKATKLNPRTYTQIDTPTGVQRDGGRVFDMLQYFETMLPLVESL